MAILPVPVKECILFHAVFPLPPPLPFTIQDPPFFLLPDSKFFSPSSSPLLFPDPMTDDRKCHPRTFFVPAAIGIEIGVWISGMRQHLALMQSYAKVFRCDVAGLGNYALIMIMT